MAGTGNSGRPWLRRSLVCLIATGSMTLASSAAGPALPAGSALDANALVRRMVAAYRKAQTIQENTEARMVMPDGSSFIQSGAIKWRRPNQVYIYSQDPQQGTMHVYSDGRLITVYSQRQNIFTNRNAMPDLQGTMRVVTKAAQDAFGVQFNQVLSPISFLLSDGMPREARSFRFAGEASVNGRRAYKVVGQADTAWMRNMVPDATIVPVKRNVALWIDAQTSLLLKASGDFAWKVTAADGMRLEQPVTGGVFFEETHFNTRLNAPIEETAFRFRAPRGAKQLFQERSY
ncbi:MAG: DUF2092 domain-containing protein [Chloroherpetonaceae bacterium]|nr:DUF2092 domain-containing protein [Chthonomonadaceae bacterium]MDW8208094.1 DUF2092 domain-containing protein [Chloroherpetonaceae bacterium]